MSVSAIVYCELKITLTIQAPFICTATGPRHWGIDKTFHRNHKNEPVIMKSHIKGKLREALQELQNMGHPVTADQDFIHTWFGARTEELLPEDIAESSPGKIRFSDFVYTPSSHASGKDHRKRHRIRMNPVSGTADEGALIVVETPFVGGEETTWSGTLRYPAASEKEGREIRNRLLKGFRWITSLGASNTAGFGRLMKAKGDELKMTPIPKNTIQISSGEIEYLDVSFQADEPLMTGGIRIKDNYLPSADIFSGAAMKGAFAATIRRRLNLDLSSKKPDKWQKEPEVLKVFPLISEHFDDIRFTHAFPSFSKPEDGKTERSETPPLSLVKHDGQLKDVALVDEVKDIFNAADDDFQAPDFAVDWKDRSDVDLEYGWASPGRAAVTRTAIESISRRAHEEKLYTFEYLLPWDSKKRMIAWRGRVFLPEDLKDKEQRQKLAQELKFVFDNWFDAIGKRDGRIGEVSAEISSESLEPKPLETDQFKNTFVLTLQTDAILLNPEDISDGSEEQMKEAYSKYWDGAFKEKIELVRWFAEEKLAGGYPARKYRPGGKYQPFLLTGAGSVFVLKPAEGAVGEGFLDKISEWLRTGLPVPSWCTETETYGYEPKNEKADWRKLPYLPTNGYGEIAVNLKDHEARKWGKKNDQ